MKEISGSLVREVQKAGAGNAGVWNGNGANKVLNGLNDKLQIAVPPDVLAVAQACGDDDPTLSDAAATAIELLHCASLVHDDLPCFDDATTRRGRASVHFAFGESLAVLAGDALIVCAFQTLGAAASRSPKGSPNTASIA